MRDKANFNKKALQLKKYYNKRYGNWKSHRHKWRIAWSFLAQPATARLHANVQYQYWTLRTRGFELSGGGRKFSWGGGFVQWHMMVICICCALFVTSQFDVIFTFPNQRFSEVCWHNVHILLHALPLFYVSMHWI